MRDDPPASRPPGLDSRLGRPRPQSDGAGSSGTGRIDALVAGYLAGELGPEDVRALDRWLDERPERRKVLRSLGGRSEALVGARRVLDEPLDVHAWWAEFAPTLTGVRDTKPESAGMGARRRGRRAAPRTASSPAWSASWAAAAAAVALVAGGFQVVRAHHTVGADPGAAGARTYATTRGERAVISLDGARVTLGPESRLRVAGDYGERERRVWLTGHAFFDVVHDAARPFRVHAGSTLTEDLGTRFDIEAYDGAAASRVVVTQGVVAVRPASRGVPRSDTADRAVTVRAGTLASTDTAGLVRVETVTAVERYTAWSDGRLTFTDTPLPAVLVELGRWYDIDLRIGDERLARKSLTAAFVGDPVADVLHTLERALSVRAVRDGRSVTLYPAD